MKPYTAPALVEYGSVNSLTGIFGTSAQQDTFTGPTGQVIQHGTGSIDVCAQRHGICL